MLILMNLSLRNKSNLLKYQLKAENLILFNDHFQITKLVYLQIIKGFHFKTTKSLYRLGQKLLCAKIRVQCGSCIRLYTPLVLVQYNYEVELTRMNLIGKR